MRFENSRMTYLTCFQQNAKKTTHRCSLLHQQQITQNDVEQKLMASQTYLFTRDRNRIILRFSNKQLWDCYLDLQLRFGVILSQINKDMTLYPRKYQNVCRDLIQKNFSILERPLYKGL